MTLCVAVRVAVTLCVAVRVAVTLCVAVRVAVTLCVAVRVAVTLCVAVRVAVTLCVAVCVAVTLCVAVRAAVRAAVTYSKSVLCPSHYSCRCRYRDFRVCRIYCTVIVGISLSSYVSLYLLSIPRSLARQLLYEFPILTSSSDLFFYTLSSLQYTWSYLA